MGKQRGAFPILVKAGFDPAIHAFGSKQRKTGIARARNPAVVSSLLLIMKTKLPCSLA
jgi:hypothetical protein